MQFDLNKSLEILERTPTVLADLLSGLSEDWTLNNEGADTWSPFEVVGHLIHGERTDWIPRMEIILSDTADRQFEPFDQIGHHREIKGRTLQELLDTFKQLRDQNIKRLRSKKLDQHHVGRIGIHPEFGEVSLEQMLSTWVVHDLNHIAQIVRVMASQYREEVGPWKKYLKILRI